MFNNNIIYIELCCDLLQNKLDMLKSNMFLDITKNMHDPVTDHDLLLKLSPYIDSFHMQHENMYVALSNYHKNNISDESPAELINDLTGLSYRYKIPPILLKSKYRPSIGLGLVQQCAYPICYRNNP